MSEVLLEQLVREVRGLRARMNALETAEVIPSQLQASDGDPNPALSADAAGALTAAIAPFTLTGGQIKFPASQNASADANILDDYEEGTWTIGVSFGGGTTGITYGNQSATYRKVGGVVSVEGWFSLSSKGTDVGVALMTGLPFAMAGPGRQFVPIGMYAVTFANQYRGMMLATMAYVHLLEVTEVGGGSDLTNGDFANNSEVYINCTYPAA